eukprot:scaffold124509_cov19-Tisochrysis_lutea.AAC.1
MPPVHCLCVMCCRAGARRDPDRLPARPAAEEADQTGARPQPDGAAGAPGHGHPESAGGRAHRAHRVLCGPHQRDLG